MLNFTLCAATVVALASVAQADTVGFRTAGVGGAEPRPLNVAFWYPTEETGPEIEFGATPAFVGFTAIDDAEPSAGEHPLVVLSHGYGGTWRSLAWLGVALALAAVAALASETSTARAARRRPARDSLLSKSPR